LSITPTSSQKAIFRGGLKSGLPACACRMQTGPGLLIDLFTSPSKWIG